jgi:hypothetical protein
MGPQESMTRGECGRGGVEAVGPCDDQSYVVVESFGAGRCSLRGGWRRGCRRGTCGWSWRP